FRNGKQLLVNINELFHQFHNLLYGQCMSPLLRFISLSNIQSFFQLFYTDPLYIRPTPPLALFQEYSGNGLLADVRTPAAVSPLKISPPYLLLKVLSSLAFAFAAHFYMG